jgi:hypothetical protein
MKSLLGIALVAATTATAFTLLTLGLVGERAPARALEPDGPGQLVRAAGARRDTSSVASGAPAAPADDLGPRLDEIALRLAEIESRLRRLEVGRPVAERAPVATGQPELAAAAERSDLKALLREVLTEVEDERLADQLQTAEAEVEAQMRFDMRMTLEDMLTDDFDLTPEDKDWVVEVFLEHQRRHRELMESIDPATTDPEQLEAELELAERWMRDRLRDELGQELVELLLGPGEGD